MKASPCLELSTVTRIYDKEPVELLKSPHILTAESVCSFYNVDRNIGLTKKQVEERLRRFGFNTLAHEETKSLWNLLIEQFHDLLTRILLGAAFLSFTLTFFSDDASNGLAAYIEPLVIFLILIANACVSIWQETKAEKSLEALKKLQPEFAWVLRDGVFSSVNSAELVPGDLCKVHVGTCIPADMRILDIETISFRVEQSQFTGESAPVNKDTRTLANSSIHCELQDKKNMLFFSTTVAGGSALAVVTATGMETELGRIQKAVLSAKLDEEQTPLQKKLDEFGRSLSRAIGCICVLVWVINFKNFSEPSHGGMLRGSVYYFKTAVALAVAAIPEGLTAVITTCLALGTRRMAMKNAIVRRLNSVETLGCTTVICTDKTGTLTTNEMSCIEFSVPEDLDKLQTYTVEGVSYKPLGRVRNTLTRTPFNYITEDAVALQYFALCITLCNETRLCFADGTQGPRYTFHGEPTEAALKVLVEKLGCPDISINAANLQNPSRTNPEAFGMYWASQLRRIAILEFTRDRKSMSVFCLNDKTGNLVQLVKGAPECILERCTSYMLPNGHIVPLSIKMQQEIMNKTESMGYQGLRVLALALSLTPSLSFQSLNEGSETREKLNDPNNYITYETNLTFCGLVGVLDPPRPEVKDAIKLCHVAGVKVHMITGDNKTTAESIAEMTGICSRNNMKRISVTGKEFEAMSHEKQLDILKSSSGAIFSRTEPRHKQMIIRRLNELGEITAMTGDGVNDAPALKQADIGISMGIVGTEVAREASDIILADDNFKTIVLAIEEGRSIYNNMQAFIRYLISSNIGEVASIFLTAALGIPEGLAPVQLLWVNLVTDGFPATALGFNPPETDVMKRPPRRQEDPLISSWHFLRYLIIGFYVGLATVGIFVSWYIFGVHSKDGQTLISYSQLSHWSQCKTWKHFQVNPVYNMDPNDPCTYFTTGKIKASTLSLTVLVVIEMFNALNALSENCSLLQSPPWSNPWLILSIFGSIVIHCIILYHPVLSAIVGVTPLTLTDWYSVILWSFPVLLLDEFLKILSRATITPSKISDVKKKLL